MNAESQSMYTQDLPADFNTLLTNDLIVDNALMTHPSMFQTPALNTEILNNVDTAHLMNPADMWANRISYGPARNDNLASQYTVPFDPKDPPLSKQEIQRIINRLTTVTKTNSTNTIPSLLWYFFFSTDNVRTLQNNIRYAVNKWSGHHIGDQSLTELTISMGQIYDGNARNIDEANAPSKYLFRYIRQELERLNEIVVNETVPIIIDALEQHVSYLKQVDKPRSPESLSRPMDTKITGIAEYRSPTDILSGIA